MSMDLVVITGMSGSGKSIALGALEDAGYYCVDNLPPELLEPFLALEDRLRARKVAIAMDVRSGESLPQLPLLLHGLRDKGLSLRQIFLDANDHTLVRRFSETRRRRARPTFSRRCCKPFGASANCWPICASARTSSTPAICGRRSCWPW